MKANFATSKHGKRRWRKKNANDVRANNNIPAVIRTNTNLIYITSVLTCLFIAPFTVAGQDCFQVNTSKSHILLSGGDDIKLPKSNDTLVLLCTKAIANFTFQIDFKGNTEQYFEDSTQLVAALDYKTSTFILNYDKAANAFSIPNNQPNLFEGTYTLRLSAIACPSSSGLCDNCSVYYKFTVVHKYDPDFAVSITTDPNPAILTCLPGSKVTMSGTPPPHNGFQGQWAHLDNNIFVDLPGQTAPEYTSDKSGTYLYTLRGPAGCAASFFATIVPPLLPIITVGQPQQPLNACSQPIQGITVTNGGPPGNLQLTWTTSSGGIIVSGENGDSPVIASLGAYTLSASRQDNGCKASASVVIVPGSIPTIVPKIVSISGKDVLDCRNTTIKLRASASLSSGTSSFSYVWADGTSGDELTVLAPGIYSVTVTSTELGCQGAADISIFQDISIPDLQIIRPRDTICVGETVALTALALEPVTYLWQNGSTNGSLLAMPDQNGSNTYFVTVTANDNGCTAEESAVIVRLDPPQVLCTTASITIQTGVHLSLDCSGTGDQMFWVSVSSNVRNIPPAGNGPVQGHFYSLAAPQAPGNVAYTFFARNAGCTSEPANVVVNVLPESNGGIFVPELVTPNGDGLNDTWEITFSSSTSNPGGHRMSLFDRNGALAFEGTLGAPIQVESLPDGAYFYTITKPDGGFIRGAVTILRRN